MKKVILFYRKNTLFFSDSLQHSTRVLVYYLFNSCCKEIKFKKTWVFCLAFLLLIFNQASLYGQSNTNNSQWGKNGPASAPASPVNWANGNAQGTNSHFREGQSVPTRIELVDLTPNVPASVTFNINIIQGSDVKHAFDFFTGANRIDETVNPLDGLTGYGPRSLFAFPIPNAGNTGGVPAGYYDQTAIKMACQQAADAGSPEKNSIWIYNGTVTSITYVWGNEEGTSTQQTYCTVTFIPTATKTLLALGCHVAAENSVGCGGWGIGNGASAISGSPYHFHIQGICSPLSNCVVLGSQDQQMASDAVIIPPTCSVNPSSAQVCAGATATFTATGINGSGGAPYSYSWTGPNGFTATTASITVGVAGTYSVIVRDKNGVPTVSPCTANLTVNELPNVVANDAQVCTGFTVQLSATPPGGTWSGANISPSGLFNAAGLSAGPYNVTYTYTDGNQCTNNDGAVVTVNALPTVVADNAQVCTGFTVQLSATPPGGTWSGANISASGLFNAAGLSAGPYNVTYTYTDTNQCTNNDGAVVTVNALPTVVANDAQVCTGFTVQLSATPPGGTWSGANISPSGLFDAAGLSAGPYNVTYTYTDGNQCTNNDGAVVTVNALPTVVADNAQVCTGFTVQLSATPPGGTWSGANISASGLFNAAGLAAGPYNVTYTYTDGNQCTNSDGAVVTVNALPTVVADNAQVCTGFTVQLSATPPGGTWSGANISASGLFNAAGLAAGPYNVTYTYTDGNQCTNNDGAVVTVNALPTVVANDAQVCTGFTVQLSATPPGGTWSGANISASGLFDAAGLAAGPYNVTYTYTDGNQCTNNDGAVVTVNPLPVVNCPENASAPVLCGVTQSIAQAQANSDFQAWMNQFAGLNPGLNSDYTITPSFTYSAGATPPNVGDAPLILAFSNPAIISTSVTVLWTVTNENTGCINSCSATFTLEFGCAVQCIATPSHVLCNGAATGSISVTPTGGALPYNVYLYKLPDLVTPVAQVLNILTDGVPIPFNNLSAGNYVAITTDATTTIENGSACPATINQPSAIQASDSHNDVLCNGGSTGSVTLNFSGGVGPYMVNFNGGGFALQVSGVVYDNLAAGNYPWIVRDANNCIFDGSEQVGQPSAIQASDSHNDVLCNGGSTGSVTLNFSGGVGPYMVNFNGGGFASQVSGVVYDNLAAGNYPWIVRDANNCIFDGSETVGQPSEVQLSLIAEPENCAGTNSGSITATFSGGTDGYTISIDGGPFVPATSPHTFNNLGTGLHTVVVLDRNDCRDSAEIRVSLIVCDGPHCTYTQGYYGDYNGSACTIEGAPTTDYLIMLDAITDVGGTYDFGRIATGNYFRLFSSDITGAANIANNKIFIMLPGGGTPRALIGYDYYDNPAAVASSWRNDGNPLTKSGSKMGAINNNLLSQTMTLFFNTHVDPTLVSFPLEVKFATQDVACGSNVPIPGTYKEFSIPASVINYLTANGGATVGNLFNLANDALGGVNVGVSHADVNKAVDAINNAFDECRVKVPLQVPFPTFVYNSVVNHEPIFTVYPVPFRDQLTIRYQFEDVAKAKIDIYNSTGTLLMSQDDNNAYFNKEVTITPKFNVGEAQLYFVKVTTDRGQSVLKVISEK